MSAPPPVARAGPIGWARRNLFSTPANAALTLAALWFLWQIVPPLLDWAVFDAAWSGGGPRDCPDRDAACWVFVQARLPNLIYGSYPRPERWRVDLVFAAAAVGIAWLLLPRLPGKGRVALALVFVVPPLAGGLLLGGWGGLPAVPTASWGGLMLTLVVAAWAIVTSIPLGLVLGLGRRSALPVVRGLSIAFIEFWRGVPLIAVLFLAVVMFPLFVPPGVESDPLLRALVAFTVFNAAYMAEVFRGGLQAIPPGQYEAARAMGLGYWRMMGLVILPQAVRIAVPALVNTCIGIFKESTLILVIGLFDFLAAIQAGMADPEWLIGEHIRTTGYVFAAAGYWAFCFGMARYAQRLERRGAPAAGGAEAVRA